MKLPSSRVSIIKGAGIASGLHRYLWYKEREESKVMSKFVKIWNPFKKRTSLFCHHILPISGINIARKI